MFNDSNWEQPTWSSTSVSQHRGGYKVKGDWVYINVAIIPKNSEVGYAAGDGMFKLPLSYVPLDISKIYTITGYGRYPVVITISKDTGYINLCGGWNNSSWISIIVFYKYK